MREDRIAEVADMLACAWRDGTSIEALSEALMPGDLAEAAAMQRAAAERLGQAVVGWKVAGQPGPMVGRVFSSRLFLAGATLPGHLFRIPHVECELGFRLLRDLPPRDAAYESDEVAAAANLVFTMEIVDSRFTGGKLIPDSEDERLSIVADNAANAALVVGPEMEDWRGLSLLEIPVELRIDGGEPEPENPIERRTEPLEVLTWLANELSDRGIGLKAGQYVTPGSATLPRPLPHGGRAIAHYGEHATIEISISEA